jgi:hypothetical protein
MKLAVLFLYAALGFAGPLRIATYPVVHPVKVAKGLGAAGKGVFVAVKAIVW